jgi:spore photoproduct lyase
MPISNLFVEREVCELPGVKFIQAKLGMPARIVDDMAPVFDMLSGAADPVQKAKEIIVLRKNKGAFVKECPGTRNYTCCGYKILHIGTYCTMDCSYCILQSYFHPPMLQLFMNHDELYSELEALFSQDVITRIGTGEFTDSLIWETWTDLTQTLVHKFSRQSRAVLELKTKTVSIHGLRALDHHRKTIVSLSLNTETVMRSEERHTAPLSARLAAAKKCESWGYPLAFHFDPIVLYDGCEMDYQKVIRKLFSEVSAENIVWISLGTFRYMPALKKIIQTRFPASRIAYGEFIPGLDGKMRYFKPLRIAVYQKMISWIRQAAPEVLIYFCMEDDEVWQTTMGFLPAERGGLPKMLDESAVKHCGLKPAGRDESRKHEIRLNPLKTNTETSHAFPLKKK